VTELRWLDGQALDETTYAAVHAVVAAVVARRGAVGWEHVPGRPEVDDWLREVVRSGRIVTAYDGAELLGLGTWRRLDYPVLRHNGEIRRVMTHPDARGRGLARAVTSALVEDARRSGVEVVTIDCRGNNHGALALYASLGFVPTGRRPDYIAIGDERFDQVLLHLDLRSGPGGTVRHGGRRESAGST
jgi:ribosomal protein S18 acetylase RimI-like enzyme